MNGCYSNHRNQLLSACSNKYALNNENVPNRQYQTWAELLRFTNELDIEAINGQPVWFIQERVLFMATTSTS